MNSKSGFLESQMTFFDSQPKPGKLIFSLSIPGRLPSWNEILGMEHWGRHKLKGELANTFLYAVRRTESGSLMKTTSAANTYSIYAGTLELYLQTRRELRKSKLAKKKLALKKLKESPSKSSSSKVPF